MIENRQPGGGAESSLKTMKTVIVIQTGIRFETLKPMKFKF